jgi:TolB-like protein
MQVVWPDTVVEENNLNQNISTLRRALGESRGENRFIATIPGKGYRFIATVELAAATLAAIPKRVTLAVLPFENLSADPQREYLADGLTEETIATLGQIDPDHLSVIGRTSVMSCKRTTKSLAEIGLELDAAYLIESSIRAEGGHLRITSKLIRVSDQVQIWSASYDSEPRSMLAFQRELSAAIAEQVHLHLSPDRLSALARRHSRNAEAYDLYLRGRHFWNQLTPPPPAEPSNTSPAPPNSTQITRWPGPAWQTLTPPAQSMAMRRHSLSGPAPKKPPPMPSKRNQNSRKCKLPLVS